MRWKMGLEIRTAIMLRVSPHWSGAKELPPQEGDSCYRYPHARPHSTLDHWDQNSSEPGARAANHVHDSHEEFWYIHEGSGSCRAKRPHL